MQRARMKRVLFIAAACVAVVIVILLLPPVQTALFRTAAGGVEGMQVEVERIWAGPWGAEVRGLTVTAPGLEVTVPHAVADVAFWSSLVHLGLHIEDARAEDLVVRVAGYSDYFCDIGKELQDDVAMLGDDGGSV